MHSNERADLLRDLGIALEAMREIQYIPIRGGEVAHGFIAGKSSALDLSDNFVDMSVETALPFVLTQHALQPAVVRVENVAAIRTTSGAAERRDDAVFLDGRYGRRAGVVVESAEGPILIDIDASGVRITRIELPEDYSKLEHWEPLPELLSPPAPSLSDLLDGRSCEDWLQQRVERLANSSWLVDQVAGVGTVLRLWSPSYAAGGTILDAGASGPSAAASAWIRSLAPEQRVAVERLAIQQAATLHARIDEIAEFENDPTPEEVRRILHERDGLESVLSMLWLTGDGRGLGVELAMLDDVALTSLSGIAPFDLLETDELLQAVFTTEPDAWWGELAAG